MGYRVRNNRIRYDRVRSYRVRSDRVRSDRGRNDQVRNDRELEMKVNHRIYIHISYTFPMFCFNEQT